ncbi:MAG: YkvA family protein [Pyrinomonadaceae bacterium]
MTKRMETKNKIKRREKSEMKGRLRSFLMFLPNMVMLLGRLIKDSRVPNAEKVLFIAAIVYVISPLDLIPDIFPFIGQVDDLYVVALTLLRLVNHTDAAVIRQHWSGGGDIVALAESIASIAPKFLPKRVSRVLTSRVELAPAGKILNSLTKREGAVVREAAGEDEIDAETHSGMAN